MIEASPPAPLQKRGESSLQLPGSEITQNTLNHDVLATNQWCKPNAENELARAMLRRRPLMPNGNGSPKGQRKARSNTQIFIYLCKSVCQSQPGKSRGTPRPYSPYGGSN